MMTRKDYRVIARVVFAQAYIGDAETQREKDIILNTIARFADYAQHDNPRFDRERFMLAATKEDAS